MRAPGSTCAGSVSTGESWRLSRGPVATASHCPVRPGLAQYASDSREEQVPQKVSDLLKCYETANDGEIDFPQKVVDASPKGRRRISKGCRPPPIRSSTR